MTHYRFSQNYVRRGGKKQKFWQATLDGPLIVVESGIVGGPIRTQRRTFKDSEATFTWYVTQVHEHYRAGYVKAGKIDVAAPPRKPLRIEERARPKLADVITAATQLREHLDAVKNPDYAVMTVRKAKPKKRAVPPTYLAFVTGFGAFEIKSEGGHSYYRMALPEEVESISVDDVGGFDGGPFKNATEYARRIKKLLRFQNAPYPDNVFAFDRARVRADSEMPVVRADHDEMFTPSPTFRSFLVHTYELCREIAGGIV